MLLSRLVNNLRQANLLYRLINREYENEYANSTSQKLIYG